MANNIKGITVEIGGNTGPLNTALKGVNSTSRELQSELSEINRQLKFDPTNTTLLNQKQDILKQSTVQLTEKQTVLKTSLEQLKKSIASGDFGKKQIDSVQKSLNSVNQKLQEGTGDTKALKAQQKELTEQLSQLQEKAEKGTLGVDKVRALEREIISTEGVLKSLKKQADDSVQSLQKISSASGKVSDTMSSVGHSMAPATVAIAAAGAAAVKLGSDAIESENKVDVAFGKSAQSIKGFSKTTLKEFGIASGSALDMASTFGDMATSMGLPQQKAAEMSEKLVGLAGDLSSFKNIDLSESQTALNAIFTGETESLKKLGIVMTEANLNSFAMENGSKKTVQQMTESEKVQLRYQYVLNATKNAQGDFARTSDGAANSLRVAKESVKETGESFGTALAPLVAKAAQAITSLLDKLNGLDSNTKNIILTVAGAIAVIAPILMIGSKIAGIISAVTGAMALLKTATLAQTIAQFGLNAALLANPITWIVIAIVALVAGIIILWNNCEGFRNFITNAFNIIKTAFMTVINAIKTAFDAVVNFFRPIVEQNAKVTLAVFNAIKTGFTNAINGIKGAFDAVVNFFKPIVEQNAKVTLAVFDAIKAGFTNAINGIKGAFDAVVNFFKPIVEQNAKTTLTVFNAVKAGFTTAINGIKQGFTNAVNGIKTAWSAVTGFFTGIYNKVTSIFAGIGNFFGNVFGTAVNNVKKAFSTVTGFFTNIWNGIVGGIKGAINSAINGINTLIRGANKFKIDIPSWVPGLGGKAFGLNIPLIPKLATGTIVDSATLAMIGEAGKEAVVPFGKDKSAVRELANEIVNAQRPGEEKRESVIVNQYFNEKNQSPAEIARQSRNGYKKFLLGV